MDRRRFIRDSVLGVVATSGGPLLESCKSGKSSSERGTEEETREYAKRGPSLFPLEVPGKQWAQFSAEGFSEPACGIIYRRTDEVPHGMPLGGVATGSLDLDTDGTFGFCNLFNSGVPTRGPLQYGFLGLSAEGRTWILSTRAVTGTESAQDIHYWGHYPIADLEYELDAPLSVGLRAWTPFVPGDVKTSNTPAAIFEDNLRNSTPQSQKATLGFRFPGPTQAEAQISSTSPRKLRFIDWFPASDPVAHGAIPARRQQVQRGQFSGLSVDAQTGTGYVLGAVSGRMDMTGLLASNGWP